MSHFHRSISIQYQFGVILAQFFAKYAPSEGDNEKQNALYLSQKAHRKFF